jgi:hypothetical protein
MSPTAASCWTFPPEAPTGDRAYADTHRVSGSSFWVVFLIFVAVAGGIALGTYYARRRRQDAFALFARQYALEFSIEDPFGLVSLPFTLFQRGDGRGVENVLYGGWQGMSVHAFDYWYYDESTDSNGNSSKTYRRFCCAVTPIEAACSPLSIDEENLLTRLADMVALDDIGFESEEFNRAFNVQGRDRAFATAFVDARMMSWLLSHGRGYAFEVVGDQVLVACDRVPPLQLLQLLGTAKAFVEQVPTVVFSLYPKSG